MESLRASREDEMRRRDIVSGVMAAVAAPSVIHAQRNGKVLRVGATGFSRTEAHWQAFERRMAELGYRGGDNFVFDLIESRTFGDPLPLYRTLAERNADVFVVVGTEHNVKAALAVADTKPIVMVAIDYDPVAFGHASSLARPAGNVTGVFFQQIELTTKRLQLFADACPDMRAATVFWLPRVAAQWKAVQEAAPLLGLDLAGVELGDRSLDYERALREVSPRHRGHLFVVSSGPFFVDRRRLALFAKRHGIPAMFAAREWVDAGGLLSFGPNSTVMFARLADYVDRIARGATPSELPIEQPSAFELAVNLQTADALGLTLPRSILARADVVIE